MEHPVKILMLEHDPNDIELASYELKKSDLVYTLEIVQTRKDFENSLKNFVPDIILSDYSLPSFDGLSAFNIKRKLAPETPFIIVSGTIGEENAVELIRNGVTDYVLKDRLFPLAQKIKRAINESRRLNEKAIAEKNLKESERRLTEAQAIAKIGNWELNYKTKETIWSDEIYNILGIKKGEVVPSMDVFLSFVHPEESQQIEERIRDRDFSPEGTVLYNRIYRKDGTERIIYSDYRYELDETGEPSRLYGIIHDVTEVKKMEENLRAVNKELEIFIYRASHDLRGPLASIIGLTNISKKKLSDPLSVQYMGMIEASARKLDSTLLQLVRSMSIKDTKLFEDQINFDALVKDVLKNFQHYAGFSRLNVITEIPSGISFVSNKLILESILQNLVENSIKYQNFSAREPFVQIAVSRQRETILISVKDNGVGIDPSVKNNIFDMYYRGTMSSSGSGLGLYIVKRGVEKLRGRISVESETGKGSSFEISLPAYALQ